MVQDHGLQQINLQVIVLDELLDKFINLIEARNLFQHSYFTTSIASSTVKFNGGFVVGPEDVFPFDSIDTVLAHFGYHVPNARLIHGLSGGSEPNMVRHIRDDHTLLQMFWMEVRSAIVIVEVNLSHGVVAEELNQLLFLGAVALLVLLLLEVPPEHLVETELCAFDAPPKLPGGCHGNGTEAE